MSDLVAKLRRITASGRANHLSKADRLRIADRIEALEAEKRDVGEDLSDTLSQSWKNLARAVAAEDKVRALEAENARLREAERTAWERGRAAAAGIAIEVASYGSSDDSSYDAGRIYAAKRIHREICALSPESKINWRNDPDAIVEDDEPQIGRDYA